VGGVTPRFPGTPLGMVDNTEKKKAPMAVWLIATIAIGLLIMLAIGVAVL
jgi:hypothetical protein